jgi:hypothetical protein
MDDVKFDAIVKTMVGSDSRRHLFKSMWRVGAGLAAVRLGLGASGADARCRDYGCSCNGGVYQNCRGSLVCCQYSSGMPGGLGQCLTEDECYGPQCIDSGGSCAAYCGWGSDCFDCCSGYCNDFGVCDIPRCSGPGCSCNTGTLSPCDYGLQCCPFDTGLYGGPGACAPIGSC